MCACSANARRDGTRVQRKMQTFFANGLTVIGHRGWPTRFPDNANDGIAAALETVGAAEVDVRRSRDGRLVLCHDPVLAGRVVAETDWRELAEIDLGAGHTPVLLEDLLAADPPGRLDLEVKNLPGEPGFEEDHRLALDTAALARAGDLVSCFHWPSLAAVRRELPGVETGVLVAPPTGLDDALAEAVDGGHRAVLPLWTMVGGDPAFVRRAGDAGVPVAVWTVDDPVTARQLAEAGVRGIITNDPGGMAAAIDGGTR